jgi:hypothetical protein
MTPDNVDSWSRSYCRACWREIENQNRFCGYCGTYAHAFRMPRVLRCDGVYVTKRKVDNGIVIRSHLRFYPDGFVIGIVFGSRKDDVLTPWWGRHDQDGMKGYYRIKGRDIEFACTDAEKTRIYVGKVRKDGLRITSVDGKPLNRFYRFVLGQEGDRGSEELSRINNEDNNLGQ